MMMAPAMRVSIDSRSIRKPPRALAVAPSAMKTIENPRMKASDENRIAAAHVGWCGDHGHGGARGGPDAHRPLAPHLVERDARDVGEVARDERQHAGRDEREHARAEGRNQRDVFFHVAPGPPSVGPLILHRLERDVGAPRRHSFHLHVVPLHGRQVLVQEVPLPPLGRIRGLQPVAGRHSRAKTIAIDGLVGVYPAAAAAGRAARRPTTV
jgi:hypothetical protein